MPVAMIRRVLLLVALAVVARAQPGGVDPDLDFTVYYTSENVTTGQELALDPQTVRSFTESWEIDSPGPQAKAGGSGMSLSIDVTPISIVVELVQNPSTTAFLERFYLYFNGRNITSVTITSPNPLPGSVSFNELPPGTQIEPLDPDGLFPLTDVLETGALLLTYDTTLFSTIPFPTSIVFDIVAPEPGTFTPTSSPVQTAFPTPSPVLTPQPTFVPTRAPTSQPTPEPNLTDEPTSPPVETSNPTSAPTFGKSRSSGEHVKCSL